MGPARGAVLVDHGGADAFEQVALVDAAPGDAEFAGEGPLEARIGAGVAHEAEGAGERERAEPVQGLERVDAPVAEGLEARDEGGEIGGGEGGVDVDVALGEGGHRDRGAEIGQGGFDVAGLLEAGGELGPALAGDEDIGEAGLDGVARAHAVAGEAEIFAQMPARAAEQVGAADIGHEADGAFGHGDAGGLAGDAVAAVAGDADAAAHDEALHQGDIGFGVGGDAGVEGVFLAPEAARDGEVALPAGRVDLRDVAAGAEGAVARGVDQDEGDGGVVCARR